ncbi:cysteine-rich receptor-like protein kinase 35 [Dorcoceras hygrometricum]|uniref:Cysteine-rich receptor-like protein kinase 35 n=1 Tax=Dorcoceras hygrometricum TaxID=472368 RepID=A0A2Z7AJT0_9LAMI|nr:cysteine-rich receptor-like protein kinase 35 [Dorcoceras hygrometricum]
MTVRWNLINGCDAASHGLWSSPENTIRPLSSRPRVSLSTTGVQLHEDHSFLQDCGFHLGSRPQLYILLSFNSSSRTRGGDTSDAPHKHLGTRGPSSSLETPTCATKIENRSRTRVKIGSLPEDSLPVREYLPRINLDVVKSPTWREDPENHGESPPRYSLPTAIALYKYQTSRRSISHLPVPDAPELPTWWC